MLVIALMIGITVAIVVLQSIDRNGETLEVTLVLLPMLPTLFLIGFLTGPTMTVA